MPFKFLIKDLIHLESSKVWIIEGLLESGNIIRESVGKMMGNKNLITIFKNITLPNFKDIGSGHLAMAIEEPNFPFEILEEGMVIEGE